MVQQGADTRRYPGLSIRQQSRKRGTGRQSSERIGVVVRGGRWERRRARGEKNGMRSEGVEDGWWDGRKEVPVLWYEN